MLLTASSHNFESNMIHNPNYFTTLFIHRISHSDNTLFFLCIGLQNNCSTQLLFPYEWSKISGAGIIIVTWLQIDSAHLTLRTMSFQFVFPPRHWPMCNLHSAMEWKYSNISAGLCDVMQSAISIVSTILSYYQGHSCNHTDELD